jgi:cell wall-associated NlpC family hydrolase
MKIMIKIAICISFVFAVTLAAACQPFTAEESEAQRAYYEKKYANEPEPQGDVAKLLDLLDTCVGGQYIIGGQGTPITDDFIDSMYRNHPDYFDNGRLEYLHNIAEKGEDEGIEYPADYAWDCSGLWWYAVNELGFYDEYTDRTANDTYYDYCTPISKDELAPGDIVFYMDDEGHVSHMGIVGRHGHIYEAVSGFVGVVCKRTVDRRIYNNIVSGGIMVNSNWNAYGRPKIFE